MTLKTWVRTSATNLKEYFYLNDWSLDLVWNETDEDTEAVASITPDARYLRATIRIFPRFFEFWDKGNIDLLKEAMVHEFTHILMEPIAELARKNASDATAFYYTQILEQQTQRTSLVIGRGIPKNIFPKV